MRVALSHSVKWNVRAPMDLTLPPSNVFRGSNGGIDKRGSIPPDNRPGETPGPAEKGAMQNTKLQKYTRGAGNDRTRAVRVSIVYHLQYEQQYG